MLILSGSSSIFQLAAAVNAAVPVLLLDLENLRERAAESVLRKVREADSGFQIEERDREAFVHLVVRSTPALRYCARLTHCSVILSVALSLAALAALCWAAISPEYVISVPLLLVFVIITLVAAPAYYILCNRLLKRVYSAIAARYSPSPAELKALGRRLHSYLEKKNEFEKLNKTIEEAWTEGRLLKWRLRWRRFRRVARKLKSQT